MKMFAIGQLSSERLVINDLNWLVVIPLLLNLWQDELKEGLLECLDVLGGRKTDEHCPQ